MKQARIGGLDGVRAIAITEVIGGHLAQQTHYKFLSQIFWGQDGVGLFFTLSGFLVTTLLLREWDSTGDIKLRYFYFRRAVRILPPALFYILVVLVGFLALGMTVPVNSFVSAAFFYHNMLHGDTVWQLEHMWSLAVEEQFYLIWPIILLLCLKRGRKVTAWVCAALIAVAPILRVSAHLFQWGWAQHKIPYLLPTRMDGLMAGCMIACLVGSVAFERTQVFLSRFWPVGLILLFVATPVLVQTLGTNYQLGPGLTLNAVLGAWFILWVSRLETGSISRFMNSKPVAQLGIMSYSVYLWQTLATHTSHNWVTALEGLLFIALASSFSFFFIEKWAAHGRKVVERKWLGRLYAPDGGLKASQIQVETINT